MVAMAGAEFCTRQTTYVPAGFSKEFQWWPWREQSSAHGKQRMFLQDSARSSNGGHGGSRVLHTANNVCSCRIQQGVPMVAMAGAEFCTRQTTYVPAGFS